ncbi:sensor histidine kinase [Microvirga brassicacearum]|uniref:histidine kinase n=1 Tax=Microvirga brassicacearum TaxID=2580413 RepID=A0A5N3P715_9HYPH|nr:sensor histidine kinase [Microvirga brassicacearum]KAB0265519.1 sensor histidine kinase [Microvirga brassicacearum]
MSEFEQNGLGTLDWVLILAPYRKDASYTAALLHEHKIAARAASQADLPDFLAAHPGVLVVTHEALNSDTTGVIACFLRDQPNWSEIPIVVLVDRTAPRSTIQATLSREWPRSRLLFYQRPVAALELISGIQSALLARHRQREFRDYLARESELRLELDHRVKNILASVLSIFDMTRRGATTIEDLSNDFRGRLTALSNVHSAVFLAGGEEVPLDDVADSTLSPYRSEEPTRISIEGPRVLVRREAATTLALCIHELATNAIKYGALSRPEGRISLRWDLSAPSNPDLMFSWTEMGGPAVVEPSRAGYGTRYIRSALAGLFTTSPDLAFDRSGFRCSVRGPLSRVSLKH